jgi:hypothetical protein
MNAGRQSQFVEFYGRGQSTATATKEGKTEDLVDLDD